MSTNYETVIIFSPILAEDDIKKAVAKYKKLLQNHDATIVEERDWGLKQMAYPIQGKSNGIYYILEYETADNTTVSKIEVEYKRDESILRFMTVALDKYGKEYNEKRRLGLVGKNKKIQDTQTAGA